MQDYKRIVSYIYAYENNEKRNNTGFAKFEARGNVGQLRCQLNNKSGLNDETLEVYFLHIGEYHEGIKLGECRAGKANGQVDAEFMVNTEDVAASGLDLSKMHGLYLRTKGESGKVFASSWVEEDLKLEGFREYAKADEIKAAWEEPVEENVAETEAAPLQAAVIEPEPGSDENAKEKEIMKTFFDALEKYEKEEAADEGEPANVSAEEVLESWQEDRKTPWDSLCSRYPKVIAFENNMSCCCLKVDMKDIEAIFGKEFNTAPNTFAVRSYMKYRYLLLIENEKDTTGGSCMLGAPGIYCNNDNRVAGMCGFKEFKPSKNAEKMNCRFGYWLKEVKL